MAFDPENHYFDPVTGYMRHKDTHHLIGMESAPTPKHPDDGGEFPKWVVPHSGHIQRNLRGGISTPDFEDHHVARDGTVTVQVKDADDEEFALSDPKDTTED